MNLKQMKLGASVTVTAAPELKNGTQVKVQEETPRGALRQPWTGIVKDIRKNVKGLGSIEYLVEDTATKRSQWVSKSFIEVKASVQADEAKYVVMKGAKFLDRTGFSFTGTASKALIFEAGEKHVAENMVKRHPGSAIVKYDFRTMH